MPPNPAGLLPGAFSALAKLHTTAARFLTIQEPADPHARYPCAIVSVAAAMALHILLWPLLGSKEPYVTFYAAVVFVALQWGIGPAIVTAVLSSLVAQFFVLPATYMVPLQGADKIAGWLTFFLICAVIIGLARACRSASKRLALAHRQLQLERDAFDDRVRERTAELEKMQELRQRLMARVMRSQEEERHRISRDLQDDFSQRLALFCIELDRLSAQASGAQELQAGLHRLSRQAERLSFDVRDASYELGYSDLRLDLLLGASALCSRFAREHGVDIRFEHQGDFAFVSESASVAFYRVLQEALRNAVEHGHCTEILVAIVIADSAAELRVHDNGSGFDPSSPAASAGLGFLDMRERLSQIGGSLSLESSPAQGTEVIARLPFVPAKFSATPS